MIDEKTLVRTTDRIVLWRESFTVGDVTVQPDQSTCYHSVVTQPGVAATCTTDGLSEGAYCAKCGKVLSVQATVPATGHSFSTEVIAGNCQEYEQIRNTCTTCGYSEQIYTDALSQWSATKPQGVDETLIETKAQYRYRDLEVITSFDPELDGYTRTGCNWRLPIVGAVRYVADWPEGFDTTNSLYTAYNKTPVTAYETETEKLTVESNEIVGYIYYHWCRGSYSAGPINRLTSKTQTDVFKAFHGFYSMTDPATLTVSSAGDRYTYSNSTCCKDTYWYYCVPVYRQDYTTFRALYTYERWLEWSDWSDTAYVAGDTRQVQSRTLYRYTGAKLGDHNYVDGVCGICGDVTAVPTITPKYPALSFEDEIRMDVYFEAVNLGKVGVEDMGLITFTQAVADGTVDNADAVIPGATLSGNGFYRVRTEGIAAKNLGDEIYFRIYAKLADGSYVYSRMVNYSAKTYAYSVVNGNYAERLKTLVVSMLNYGAAAQTYFGYKTDALVNANLTAEQQALAKGYSADMVMPVVKADSSKVGVFANTGGFDRRYPTVSFESAFAINYFFTPSSTPDGEMNLYYWNQAAYENADVLTSDNATGCVTMTGGAEYSAVVRGIAARDLDSTVYVAAVYESGGVSYCSGVLAYSIGAYCVDRAANGSVAMQSFAAATAVYGHYAKAYFS